MQTNASTHTRRIRWGRYIGFCALLFLCTLWIGCDVLFGRAALLPAPVLNGQNRRAHGQDAPAAVTVEVPYLVGRLFCDNLPLHNTTVSSPEKTAAPLFRWEVVYLYDKAPPRTILSQAPSGGTRRKVIPGQSPCAVRLTVSMGEKLVEIPDLQGTDYREAEIILRRLGLRAETVRVRNTDALADTVLTTSPGPRDACSPGSKVRLFVAEI